MLKRQPIQATNWAADLTLLHLGLLIGLSHLAISLQLGVALAERNAMVRTIVLFVYPVAFATMGLGAVLRRRFDDRFDTTGLLRLGGISLLVFLGLALRTSYATAPVAVVAAGLINGIGSIGPIFQEEIIGWTLDNYGYAASLNLLVGMAILAVIGTAILALRCHRNLAAL